jgi:hypothetical protein
MLVAVHVRIDGTDHGDLLMQSQINTLYCIHIAY